MRTRTLGPLEVSVVGLGCNNFGRRIDADATRAVVDAALEAGVTFFDTADIYGNRGGSETFLGERAPGAARPGRARHEVRADARRRRARRGSRDYVRCALDASLQRLQTDHIDLYQLHQPDRGRRSRRRSARSRSSSTRARSATSAPRTSSRTTLERGGADRAGARLPFVSEQSEYSWLDRDAEDELLPTCERLGLGFIPYFPLASGLLTGKVSRDRPPAEGTRLHGRELDDDEARPRRALARGPRRTASRCSTSRSAVSRRRRRSPR